MLDSYAAQTYTFSVFPYVFIYKKSLMIDKHQTISGNKSCLLCENSFVKR